MTAYAARARHILRASDGVKRHLDAMELAHPKGEDPAEWPEDLRVREWPEVTP